MLTYIIRRLLLLVPTLIGVTMVVFLVMALAPGGFGAALRDFEGTEGEDARYVQDYFNRRYGLDRSIPEQYLRWLNQVSPIGFRTSDDIEPPEEAAQKAREILDEAEELGPIGVRSMLRPFIERLARWRDEDPRDTAREVIERISDIDAAFAYFEEMGADEQVRERARAEVEASRTGPKREIVLDTLETFLDELDPEERKEERSTNGENGASPPGQQEGDHPEEDGQNGDDGGDAAPEVEANAAGDDAQGSDARNDDEPAEENDTKADREEDNDDDNEDEELEQEEIEQRRGALIGAHPEVGQLGPEPMQMRIAGLAEALADKLAGDPEEHMERLVSKLTEDDPTVLLDAYEVDEALREKADAAIEDAAREARIAARSALAEQLRREISGRQRVLFHRFGVKMPDFGESLTGRRSVLMMIGEALPITLVLNLLSIPIIYFVAISSGILAAKGRGQAFDVVSGLVFVAMWSIPVIWVGTLAIGYLSDEPYNFFPSGGLNSLEAEGWPLLPFTDGNGNWHRGWLLDRLWHLVLPVACMSYTGFAVLCKMTRNAMLDNLNADYVRTARAKGVQERTVVMKHVFRNSLLPLITMFSGILPGLLTGSLIVENIFSIDGMGLLAVNAAMEKDREVVMAITLIMGFVVLMAELLRDVCYAIADPRVSYE